MKFIKKNSKYIGIVMICILCSYLTTIATNYIFDSSDVRFDNTGTSLESVNVQDAIDETFHHVTDYNEIKTTIGNSTLTTTNKTLIGGINEVNSNLTTLSSNIKRKTAVTPTSSGKQTLVSYIQDVIWQNGLSDYIFSAQGFSDLPTANWSYTVTVHTEGGALYVEAYKALSSSEIYVRVINASGTWSWLNSWDSYALNSKIEPIVVNSSETVASKCTRNAPIEIKPGATGTPRSGYGYIGYCSYGGTSFRHVIVSEYLTGNLFFSFGTNIGTTWYQISYNQYNP